MKQLKKLKLHDVKVMDEMEMKRVVGGYDVDHGTITGYRCSNGKCLVDIVYDDDPTNTWCEVEKPMALCQRVGMSC